mmetsp:Transcript_4010/g.11190  ORF Transcript_4010/g.11190 Transcript_4010/m.11190 type:complete len:301 (-) Transcript_4010:751-1653(-)
MVQKPLATVRCDVGNVKDVQAHVLVRIECQEGQCAPFHEEVHGLDGGGVVVVGQPRQQALVGPFVLPLQEMDAALHVPAQDELLDGRQARDAQRSVEEPTLLQLRHGGVARGHCRRRRPVPHEHQHFRPHTEQQVPVHALRARHVASARRAPELFLGDHPPFPCGASPGALALAHLHQQPSATARVVLPPRAGCAHRQQGGERPVALVPQADRAEAQAPLPRVEQHRPAHFPGPRGHQAHLVRFLQAIGGGFHVVGCVRIRGVGIPPRFLGLPLAIRDTPHPQDGVQLLLRQPGHRPGSP